MKKTKNSEPYEDLYLAKNIDGLDQLVNRKTVIDPTKINKVCKILEDLYKFSQEHPLDQEKTYIFLARFLFIYDKFHNSDKKFIELRFGKEYGKVKYQFNDIKNCLIKRYETKYGSKGDADPIIVPVADKTPQPPKQSRIFKSKFITCLEMYSALKENNNILIVDARHSSDFQQSHMNIAQVINVPEECIVSGLSANTLGLRLVPETKKVWDKRDQFAVLILFDWDTTSENFYSSKLDKLYKALVEWDFNRNYNEPPVILNGGYLEILQVYPTICTNPHVSLQKKNNELDELLDIDNIVYPTETDNKTLIMGYEEPPEPKSKPQQLTSQDEYTTRDALLEENKNLTVARQNIICDLMDKEKEWRVMNKANIPASDNRKIKLQEEIKSLEEQLEDVNNKKEQVRQKFDLYARFDPEEETLKSDEITLVNELENKDDENMKIIEIMQEERSNALKKARALKPAVNNNNKNEEIIPMEIGEPEKPVIDRATKPAGKKVIIEPIPHLTPGKIGLRNVRNTCYMNTVIQCFRALPDIQYLFCSGIYVKFVTRQPAALVYEAAWLIRYLWSKNVRYVEPREFYNRICAIEPYFKLGRHEDCMEFFLFFLNHLIEDCSVDIERPTVMTPKQKSWYNQFQGRTSIFINLFYHQIRIQQLCPVCKTSSYKFEVENSFMLSVPEEESNLELLMKNYMNDYVIQDYLCNSCKKPVINRKSVSYQPRILVIVLKRYFTKTDGGLAKNEAKVRFPAENFKFGNTFYKLYAMALHMGDLNHGHYTAACRLKDGWFEFNDETIKPIHNIECLDIQLRATAFFYTICDNQKNDD